jgi:hypothetical protein
MDDETRQKITKLINNAYESIKHFQLNEIFRCSRRDFIRCTAVFVPGDLAIVYVKSPDAEHVNGAIILSDTFCGVRGDITESDISWARKYHGDIEVDVTL